MFGVYCDNPISRIKIQHQDVWFQKNGLVASVMVLNVNVDL